MNEGEIVFLLWEKLTREISLLVVLGSEAAAVILFGGCGFVWH